MAHSPAPYQSAYNGHISQTPQSYSAEPSGQSPPSDRLAAAAVLERAVVVARVAAEPILASDLIALAEQWQERAAQQRSEEPDAPQNSPRPSPQEIDSQRQAMIQDVLQAIDEAMRSAGPPVAPTRSELLRRSMLEQLLKEAVQIKLVCYDARRKIPSENMPHFESQLNKIFEQHELKRLMKRYGVGSWRELDQALRSRGSSIERERQRFIEQNLYRQWLRQQIKFDEEITLDQMLTYYRQNLQQFDRPPRTRWQYMFVPFSQYPNKEEAYALIARLGNQVIDGADFAEVARASKTGSDGTVRLWPDKSLRVPDVVEKAIQGLPAGTMSPILEDYRGYYIVRVVERLPGGLEPFEAVQSEIREKLKQQRIDEQMKKYLDSLRERIPVWTCLDGPDGQPAVGQRQDQQRR